MPVLSFISFVSLYPLSKLCTICIILSYHFPVPLPADSGVLRAGAACPPADWRRSGREVTFDMVGGLQEHIRDLKEMILLPLLYPEVFSSRNITPPKGVLFFGPPGAHLLPEQRHPTENTPL